MNYIQELADSIKSNVPTEVVPEDSSDLFRLYALLLLTKQYQTSTEDVHTAWATWMSGKQSSHESLVPFSVLSDEVKSQDKPFLDAIKLTLEKIDINKYK